VLAEQTPSQIPASTKSKMDEMRSLRAGLENIASFRDVLGKGRVNDPCVPLLGPYIAEVVKIEQDDEDTFSPSMVNFDKRRKLALPIRELESFRNQPFCFESIPFLRHSIIREEGERLLGMY
jgi:hypothetical protein